MFFLINSYSTYIYFFSEKELGEPIIECTGLTKQYTIEGREETVRAINRIDLNDDTEFYAIRRGEFVMVFYIYLIAYRTLLYFL